MTRLLFIIILFVVSYLVIKSFLTKLENSKKIGKQRTANTKMLKCEECGLHIPEHEAIRQGDHVFCSLEHARQRLE